MSDSLYVLTEKFLYLMEIASDPDTDPETLADTMESMNYELEDKADGYAKILRSMGAKADAIGLEISRLNKRKKSLEGNMERLRSNLEQSMIKLDKRQIKTALFSFNIQKNPPAVNVTGKVPKRFYIPQEPKLDKKGLTDYLKAHNGKTKYAELTQTESLRIR